MSSSHASQKEQGLDVAYVAELARLKLTREELDRFTHQLGDILSHMKQLGQLDLTKVPSDLMTSADVQNTLRQDICESSLSADEALANAPLRHHDLFSVPRIFE